MIKYTQAAVVFKSYQMSLYDALLMYKDLVNLLFDESEIAQYYFIDNIREFLIMVCNRILSLSNLELELIDENEYMRIRGNKNDSTSKK